MKSILAAAFAATITPLLFAPAAVAQTSAPPTKVLSTCQNCHGLTGNSTAASVPRLNGQHTEYLVDRLRAFLDPTSQDPHAIKSMWNVVSNTDSGDFSVIAAYFASQTPTPAAAGAAGAAEGKRIFTNGAAGVPACQSCHGEGGVGSGAVPRLAGQHGAYLLSQLERMQLGLRYHATMHPNLRSMTESQMKALVAYLANG